MFNLPSLRVEDRAANYDVKADPILDEYHVTHRSRAFIECAVLAPRLFGVLGTSKPSQQEHSSVEKPEVEVPTLPHAGPPETKPTETSSADGEGSLSTTKTANSPTTKATTAALLARKGSPVTSSNGSGSTDPTPEKKTSTFRFSTPSSSTSSTPEKVEYLAKDSIHYTNVEALKSSTQESSSMENTNLIRSPQVSSIAQLGQNGGIVTNTKAEHNKVEAVWKKPWLQSNSGLQFHEDHDSVTFDDNSIDSSMLVNEDAAFDKAVEVSAVCESHQVAVAVKKVSEHYRYSMRGPDLPFAQESLSLPVDPSPKNLLTVSPDTKILQRNDTAPQSSMEPFDPTLPSAGRSTQGSPVEPAKSKGPKKGTKKQQERAGKQAKKLEKDHETSTNARSTYLVKLMQSLPKFNPEAPWDSEPVTRKQQLAAKEARDLGLIRGSVKGGVSNTETVLDPSLSSSSSTAPLATELTMTEQNQGPEEAEKADELDRSPSKAHPSEQVIPKRGILESATATSIIPEPAIPAPKSISLSTAKTLTNKQKRAGKKARKALKGANPLSDAQSNAEVVEVHLGSMAASNASSPEEAVAISNFKPSHKAPVVVATASMMDSDKQSVIAVPLGVLEEPSEQHPSSVQDPLSVQDRSPAQDPSSRPLPDSSTKAKKKYKAGKKVQARKANVARLYEDATGTGQAQHDEADGPSTIVVADTVTNSTESALNDRPALVAKDMEIDTNKSIETVSEVLCEDLTSTGSCIMEQTEQADAHESTSVAPAISDRQEMPNVIVKFTENVPHIVEDATLNPMYADNETQADVGVGGSSSEIEPFPEFSQADCDDDFSQRPVPQRISLSCGAIMAWKNGKFESVENTEDTPEVESPIHSPDTAPIEDPVPSETQAPLQKPVPSDGLARAEEHIQVNDQALFGDHAPIEKIIEHMKRAQTENEPAQSDSDTLSDEVEQIDDIAQVSICGKSHCEANSAMKVNRKLEIYNPRCLLLPGETSWFSESAKARESGDFDLVELKGPIDGKSDGQYQLTSEDEIATEVPVGSSQSARLDTPPEHDNSHCEHIAEESELTAEEAVDLSESEEETSSPGAHQHELISACNADAKPFVHSNDSDVGEPKIIDKPELFEDGEVTEITTDAAQLPAENPSSVAPPDTSGHNIPKDGDVPEATQEAIQVPDDASTSVVILETSTQDTSKDGYVPEATPYIAELPTDTSSPVVNPETSGHDTSKNSNISQATSKASEQPAETSPSTKSPQTSGEDTLNTGRILEVVTTIDSNVSEATSNSPKPLEEKSSAVTPPENSANPDTGAKVGKKVDKAQAFEAIDIVHVATAVQEAPNDRCLLLQLILVLIVRFLFSLFKELGRGRRRD